MTSPRPLSEKRVNPQARGRGAYQSGSALYLHPVIKADGQSPERPLIFQSFRADNTCQGSVARLLRLSLHVQPVPEVRITP